MNALPDLLDLRLGALELDVAKVRRAVELAKVRGLHLQGAQAKAKGARKSWNGIKNHLTSLAEAMKNDPRIAELLNDEAENLAEHLVEAAARVGPLNDVFEELNECLVHATRTAVTIEDFPQAGLERRCSELQQTITALRQDVRSTAMTERRAHWVRYQELLDRRARPVFAEYVDFLGGLTLRDTGLDDRVCELTDVLLGRFSQATELSLPLPARHAALGIALHSVVLLGFPEWSIWGIPLIGHEVGMAYVAKREETADDELTALVRDHAPDDVRTEEYVEHLFADAFGAYTLGLSYGCAALLLRLSPSHDQLIDPGLPTDIDRAQVIMATLEAIDPGGGEFTEAIGYLKEIWTEAARAHAGPERADEAEREASGASPQDRWLPGFVEQAVTYCRRVPTIIPPYSGGRWQASHAWAVALAHEEDSPGWSPDPDAAVLDVLTAAWRLRIGQGPALDETREVAPWLRRGNGRIDPAAVGRDIKERWSRHRGPAR